MSMPPTEPTPDRPTPADVQATFAATLVDEWVRDGLTDAVVCPGSRSTPLALALADHPGVRLHVHHDERSGAFLALGLGLATGRPAVVLTTSGTAAAELHPAVVEADLSGVPLLVCTADRPPELRDVGAPQAIDQVHLYGRSVRWYGDPGVPEAGGADRWRALAARSFAATTGAHPGPVHLNLPFREPLVGTVGSLPPGRGDGPWTVVAPRSGRWPRDGAHLLDIDGLALADLVGRRGVIVAGLAGVDGATVHDTARTLGWPVIAEPRSTAWRPAPTLVAHVDAVLRSARATDELRPEVIVRLGAPGSSRVVNEWLAAAGAVEVVAGAPGWSDPSATAAVVVEAPAGAVLDGLRRAATGAGTTAGVGGRAADRAGSAGPDGGGWLRRWQAVSAAAAAVVDALVGDSDHRAAVREPVTDEVTDGGSTAGPGAVSPSGEPGVGRAVVRGLPAGAHLVVSSSMPIRDVERYAVPRADVRVHANRGANGIDGVVSTAVGVAAGTGASTALLVGDVAFLHDSNGLLGAAGRDVDLVCVVVDNDGGGIFSFLPQARALPAARFEALFGTPHGLDLVALASAFGVEARRLGHGEEVAGAVAAAAAKGGVHVLVVATDRHANVAWHRRIDDAVAAAVDDALGDTA